MKLNACGISRKPANEGGVADPHVNLCVHRGSIRLTLARNMTDIKLASSNRLIYSCEKVYGAEKRDQKLRQAAENLHVGESRGVCARTTMLISILRFRRRNSLPLPPN